MCCIRWNEEFNTAMSGEIIKTKQDQIVAVFRCQVIEPIVSQYCGHCSSAGVTRYIRLREPKVLEAWDCSQARVHWKLALGG